MLLDDTAVSVALPSIRRQLGLGLSGLEWVVNGYTVPIAGLMLLAGKLADRRDRRTMFRSGVAGFTRASVVAGLAPSAGALIAARVLQGVGAALVIPASLAIIASTFGERDRGSALGVWTAVSATALGLGPIVGGVVSDTLGWGWIFLLNVPLGAGAWLIAHRLLPATGSRPPKLPLDVRGAAAAAVGLTALVLALTEGNDYGWTSTRVAVLAVAAGLCLALFVHFERHARDPLLRLSLLRDGAFAGPNVVMLLATSVMCSLFFFLALYLQNILAYDTITAGAALLPLTVPIVLVAPVSGRLADRIGPRLPVAFGMLLLAIARLGLARLHVSSTLWSMIPWLAVAGIAIGLTTAPTTAAAMAGADGDRYGVAAGVLNTFRWTGLALGIALMGAVLTSGAGAGSSGRAAFVNGFSNATTLNAGIALAAAATALLTLRGSAVRPAGMAARFRRGPERASAAGRI